MKHRALIAFALLRGNLFGGMFDFGVCTRHMGKASFRKEGRYGALRSRDWEHMGWRRECDCEGQLSLTIGKRLQPVTCWAALFLKVCHVGELVLGKGVGSGGGA